MKTRPFFLFAVWLIPVIVAQGQKNPIHPDLFNLAESHKLVLFNREVTPFSESGKKGIRFSENENDGWAWIEGLTLADGVIEVDLKGRDMLQRSFLGVAFHSADDKSLDIVYFRPFNFQSPDPVRKIHAVQYISAPEYHWKKLREEQNGKYEKAVNPAPKADEWFHAKIVLQYPHITVFVNGSNDPSLSVDQLSTRKTGKIGLWVGQGSNGDFANLVVSEE